MFVNNILLFCTLKNVSGTIFDFIVFVIRKATSYYYYYYYYYGYIVILCYYYSFSYYYYYYYYYYRRAWAPVSLVSNRERSAREGGMVLRGP